MISPTEAFKIVKNAGDSDPGLKSGAFLESHLEFLEFVLVLSDLVINT